MSQSPIVLCETIAATLAAWSEFNMAMSYYYPRTRSRQMNTTFKPRMDVVEDENGYIVRIDVPGFSKEEISIEADHESLRLIAEKPEATEEEKEELSKINYLHRERYATKLVRTLAFPKPIDASKASVSLEMGVVTISLPVAEIAKSVKLVPK
ncbi:MAG: Hsp20/alpha crystallin family protein [Candidatus Heimdallarchaeota archaeon]|nr:Hsp20/alpha crystallin family protein [Candidatus Heimdallarchaeota archaeon]